MSGVQQPVNIHNFRDVGGSITANNKFTVKEGLVFVGAVPAAASFGPDLARRGIHTIFDLRSADELKGAHYSSDVASGIDRTSPERVWAPVFVEGDVPAEKLAFTRSQTSLAGILKSYDVLLEYAGSSFRQIFLRLAKLESLGPEQPPRPIFIHSVKGSDRTAIFTALLLSLLGVGHDDIARDYARSDPTVNPSGQGRDSGEGRFDYSNVDVRREDIMRAFMALLRRQYGSAEGYICGVCGLDPEEIEQIRDYMRHKIPKPEPEVPTSTEETDVTDQAVAQIESNKL